MQSSPCICSNTYCIIDNNNTRSRGNCPLIILQIKLIIITMPVFTTQKPRRFAASFMFFLLSFLISASDTTTLAFVLAPSRNQVKSPTSKTTLYKKLVDLEQSYGEQIRLYRRDQFNYESWVRHRANNRYVLLVY